MNGKPPSERYVFRAHNNLSFNGPSLNYETCERQQNRAGQRVNKHRPRNISQTFWHIGRVPILGQKQLQAPFLIDEFYAESFSQVHTIVSWCAENGDQSEVPPHTSTGCQLTQSLPQLDLQTQLQFNQSFSLQTLFKCLCWYWLLQKYQTAGQTSA